MNLLPFPTLPQAPPEAVRERDTAPSLEEIAGMMTFVVGRGYQQSELKAALALLRDAKASRYALRERRLAWVHAEVEAEVSDRSFSTPNKWQDLGRQVAEDGDVEVLITTGLHARDTAVGAREAGIFLGNVIVCTDQATACRVMIDRLFPGDCVLLHQVNTLAGETLRHAIELKWTHAAAA